MENAQQETCLQLARARKLVDQFLRAFGGRHAWRGRGAVERGVHIVEGFVYLAGGYVEIVGDMCFQRIRNPADHAGGQDGRQVFAIDQRFLNARETLRLLDQRFIGMRGNARGRVFHQRDQNGFGFGFRKCLAHALADIRALRHNFVMGDACLGDEIEHVGIGKQCAAQDQRTRHFNAVVGKQENKIVRRRDIVGQPFRQRDADRHFDVFRQPFQNIAHQFAFARRQMRTLNAIERGDREEDFFPACPLWVGGELRQPAHVTHVPCS